MTPTPEQYRVVASAILVSITLTASVGCHSVFKWPGGREQSSPLVRGSQPAAPASRHRPGSIGSPGAHSGEAGNTPSVPQGNPTLTTGGIELDDVVLDPSGVHVEADQSMEEIAASNEEQLPELVNSAVHPFARTQPPVVAPEAFRNGQRIPGEVAITDGPPAVADEPNPSGGVPDISRQPAPHRDWATTALSGEPESDPPTASPQPEMLKLTGQSAADQPSQEMSDQMNELLGEPVVRKANIIPVDPAGAPAEAASFQTTEQPVTMSLGDRSEPSANPQPSVTQPVTDDKEVATPPPTAGVTAPEPANTTDTAATTIAAEPVVTADPADLADGGETVNPADTVDTADTADTADPVARAGAAEGALADHGETAEAATVPDPLQATDTPGTSATPGTTDPAETPNRSPEPAVAAAGPRPLTWRDHVQGSIELLEATRQDADSSDAARALKEVRRRLLEVAAGSAPLEGIDLSGMSEPERQYWQQQLTSIQIMLNGLPDEEASASGHLVTRRRATAAARHLEQAASQLASQATLQVLNVAFCTEVQGFGEFTPAAPRFVPNQPVLIYCELQNYALRNADRQPDGPPAYAAELRGQYVIVDSDDRVVHQHGFQSVEDICQFRRKDFYMYFPISMPQLPPGSYRLQLSVEDLVGSKFASAEQEIDFSINAPGPLAEAAVSAAPADRKRAP